MRRGRGATWRGELLSSEGVSYGDGADKVPTWEADQVPAKEGAAVWCHQIRRWEVGDRWLA